MWFLVMASISSLAPCLGLLTGRRFLVLHERLDVLDGIAPLVADGDLGIFRHLLHLAHQLLPSLGEGAGTLMRIVCLRTSGSAQGQPSRSP